MPKYHVNQNPEQVSEEFEDEMPAPRTLPIESNRVLMIMSSRTNLITCNEEVPTFFKYPGDVLDFIFDYSELLDSDIITSSAWTVENLISEQETFVDETTTITLSGGILKQECLVINSITTVLRTEPVVRAMNIVIIPF